MSEIPKNLENPEELEDAESSPPIPAATLAGAAGRPSRWERRRTDRQLWTLAWPTILSQILASGVSLIDIAMLGRLGSDSLAAVGYATQFFMLAQSLLLAVGAACVALMSRAIGAGDTLRARRSLAACLVLAFAVAAAMVLPVLLVPGALLRLLNAEPIVVELAIPYFQLTLGSVLLLALSFTLESGFRASGDTRTPLRIASGVTVVKLVLNVLLIFGLFGLPRLELLGAGIATLLSQGVGVALFLRASRRGSSARLLGLGARDFGAARPLFGEALRLSLPGVGERAAMHLAILVYFALLAQYGSVVIAAYTVGVRILSFSWIPGIGFSVAAATLVGQSLGAGNAAAAVRSGWRAVRFAFLVSCVLGLLYALARVPLARLFTDDPGVINALDPFMLVLALAQPLLGIHFTLAGSLRGAGDTVSPMLASIVGNWAFRVPLAFLFTRVLALDVIWVWSTLVIDHLARAVWIVWVFRRGRWLSAGRVLEETSEASTSAVQ